MINKEKFNLESVKGAVLGYAVGDALGVPVEFAGREVRRIDPVKGMRSGGVHAQPAGTWSDDTSMTLCMIHSLIEKGIDYEDQMRRFGDWMEKAAYTARGEVFDIGGTTRYAISNHLRGVPALKCGDKAERACGNGSLMRMMPLAIYLAALCDDTVPAGIIADVIHRASDCTHAHRRCEMACGIYCSIIFGLCRGGELEKAVMSGLLSALVYYRDHGDFEKLYEEVAPMINIKDWTLSEIKSGGYVLDTLRSAVWCLLTTNSYAQCVLKAVNLGGDTDTTAAVAGALAGLWYGAEAIPDAWISALAQNEALDTLAGEFYYACLKGGKN